jgi:hypothetical protein
VKLGIEKPTKEIKAFQYDTKRHNVYTFKIVFSWIVYSFVLLYLIVILYNATIGGFFHASIPGFIIPHYHRPSYTDDGIPYVNPDNSWKPWY